MAVERGFQGPKFQFQSQFVQLPLDFMQKQLETKGQEQEKGNALIVDMLGKQIPVHNEDIYGIEHAKKLKTDLDSQLNALSGTDLTTPGSVQKILGVKSQFNKVFSQFGDADQLKERGAIIDTTKKSILGAEASDITKSYKLAQLKQNIQNSPMGTSIKPVGIVNEVNLPQLMMDTAKEVVSDSEETENLRVTDPNDALTMVSKTGKTVTVSRSKLINTLDNYFKHDPAVASTVAQQAEVFSRGDMDKFKALSNLNVVGENGTVDKNSLYGAAMEAALSAKTKTEASTKYDYTENREASKQYEANLKREENYITPVGTEIASSTITTEAPATAKALTDQNNNIDNQLLSQLTQAFEITPEIVAYGSTPEAQAKAYINQFGGDLNTFKRVINSKFDSSKTPGLLNLIQQKQNLQQRKEDAIAYAKSKGVDPDNIRNQMIAALPTTVTAKSGNIITTISRDEVAEGLSNSRGGVPIDNNKYSLIENPNAPGIYTLSKNGRFLGNINQSNFQKAFAIGKGLGNAVRKSVELQNEYLDKTSKEIKVPKQVADNVIIPYIYDANTGTYSPNFETGQKLTKALNTALKNGDYNGLMTDSGKTLGTIIEEKNADKTGAEIVKPSNIRFTRYPNQKGVQELVINIGNEEVRIGADQVEVLNPNTQRMQKLSDIQNTPQNKIDKAIFNAYSAGIYKIDLGNGIKIDLPAFNKLGVREGGFVDKQNLVVTVAPEDVKEFDAKQSKITGDKAINYLIKKYKENKIVL